MKTPAIQLMYDYLHCLEPSVMYKIAYNHVFGDVQDRI